MNSDKYCLGCGIKLQDDNMLGSGYTSTLENDVCSRCFRLKNYGEYQVVTKSNEEFIEILEEVNKTKDLVLYVVDLLNIEKDIKMIRNYINNKLILVLNKRDTLPKSIKDEKLKEYFSNFGLSFQDMIVVSPYNNYNIDELMHMIKKHKSSRNVYVVGHTNVGKSTLINRLIKNYSLETAMLTISPLPSTTLNKISIKFSDDLTIIDTPGLIDRGSVVNYVNSDTLKKIIPKKTIKPKTYQLKAGQSLIIDNIFRIDYVDGGRNSFTLFVSNLLNIKRVNSSRDNTLKNMPSVNHEVGYHQDLVVNGLGFVKIVEKANILVYIDNNVETFTRDSLI